jgi:hypothetical protein
VRPSLCATTPSLHPEDSKERMWFCILLFLLPIATLLLVLATASRAPSRSASGTVGVALRACLVAGEQGLPAMRTHRSSL